LYYTVSGIVTICRWRSGAQVRKINKWSSKMSLTAVSQMT